MREIDFTTALGRLLSDAKTREAFALDAAAVARQLGICAADYPAFTRLIPEHVEAQARVLLRKRWRAVAALIPETAATHKGAVDALFREYARGHWLPDALKDALAFAGWLRERGHQICEREFNRVRFAGGRHGLALNLVRVPPSRVPALQVLLRRKQRTREWLLRLGW